MVGKILVWCKFKMINRRVFCLRRPGFSKKGLTTPYITALPLLVAVKLNHEADSKMLIHGVGRNTAKKLSRASSLSFLAVGSAETLSKSRVQSGRALLARIKSLWGLNVLYKRNNRYRVKIKNH